MKKRELAQWARERCLAGIDSYINEMSHDEELNLQDWSEGREALAFQRERVREFLRIPWSFKAPVRGPKK